MGEELKPCPFCGEKPKYKPFIDSFNEDRQYVVKCGWCEAQSEWGESKHEAIRLWNKRNGEND